MGSERYVVNFSIEGPGQKQLDQMVAGFMKVQKSLGGEHGMEAGLGKTGGHLKGMEKGVGGLSSKMIGASLAGAGVVSMLHAVGDGAARAAEAGASVFVGMAGGMETLIKKGSEFEGMILRLQGTGKSREVAIEMVQKAIKFTTELPITETDAVRIMQGLATAHVDALKPIGATYDELAKKGKTVPGLDKMMGADKMKQMGPNALSMVGDMLSAMGHLGSGYQNMAIQELMHFIESGQVLSKLTFGPMIYDFRKLGHEAKTGEDRLKGMQKILEKQGALGLSQAAMSTFGGVMSNFKALLDRVTLAIMQPGEAGGLMGTLTAGFANLYSVIKEFFDESTPQGKQFLTSLREIGQMVAGFVAGAMQKLGAVIKSVFQFIADNPGIIKFAIAITALTAAVLVLGGTFVATIAGVAAFMAPFVFMPALLWLIPAAIAGIVLSLGALGVAFGVVKLAQKAWAEDMGGIRTLYEDVSLVISAAKEALEDWHGGLAAISTETAEALEKRGLMGSFLKVINLMRQVQVFYEGFMDGFGRQWEIVKTKFQKAWDTFGGTISRIVEAVKIAFKAVFGGMASGQEAVDSATSSGEAWGISAANILSDVADFAQGVADWFDKAMGGVPDILDGFSGFYQQVLDIGTAMGIMAAAASMAFNYMKIGVYGLAAVVTPILASMLATAQSVGMAAQGDFSGAAKNYSDSMSKAFEMAGEYASKSAEAAGKVGENVSKLSEKMGEFKQNEEKAKGFRAKAEAIRQAEADKPARQPKPVPIPGAPPPREQWDAINAKEKEERLGKAATANPVVMTSNITLQLEGEQIAKVVLKQMKDQYENSGAT